MPFRLRRRLKCNAQGTIDVRLSDDERRQIEHLADQVRDMLDDSTDPSLRRLFPPAYADDAARDAAYQMQMGDELRQSHLESIETLRTGADEATLTPEQATAWLQAINATRLVVGTRLDITDDDGPVVISRDDPDVPLWIAYEFLTELLGELVEALTLH